VSSAAAPQKERCGTRQPSLEEVDQIEQQISRARSKVKSSVTMPVWFHVIDQGSGFANGEIPESMIRGQLRVLEDSFSDRTGGAGTPFKFALAGVIRTTNRTWFESMATDFELELEIKQRPRRGGPETLNIYTVDGGPVPRVRALPSVLTLPSYAALDGVVLDWRTLPGGTFEIYSEGGHRHARSRPLAGAVPHVRGQVQREERIRCRHAGGIRARVLLPDRPRFLCGDIEAWRRSHLQLHGLHAGFVHAPVHGRPGAAHAGGVGRVPIGRVAPKRTDHGHRDERRIARGPPDPPRAAVRPKPIRFLVRKST
jgi:hypothetical protein